MKKMMATKMMATKMMAAMIMLTSMTMGISAFAQDPAPKEVVETFNRNFPNASDVQWDARGELHVASFVQEDSKLTAYFEENGELLKFTRFIESRNLPLSVQQSLNQTYDLYNRDKSVLEVSHADGSTSYLIRFEARGKNFIVQSDASGVLTVIRKVKA